MTIKQHDGRTRWTDIWADRIALWNRRRTMERGNLGSREFWNGFDLWGEYERYTRYPGRMLESMLACIDNDATVLDVGAGSGSISVPIAKMALSVTAIEPSSAQIRRLEVKARCANVRNIAVVERKWEEVNVEDIGFHDVVIASYCLFMADIAAALRKMYDAATKEVLLVHLASHDLQRLLRGIRGRDALIPDLRILLNVLKEMELNAGVRVFKRDFELPLDLQLNMFRYAQGFSEEQIESLRERLEKSGRTFIRQGTPWLKRQYRDALVSIAKH